MQTQTIKGKDCVTNSAMGCFKSCRRKYYYSYELGWRPEVESTPLRFGSAFHEGLDLLAKNHTVDEICDLIDVMYDSYTSNFSDVELIYKFQIETETIKTLLRNYARIWSDSQLRILESEASFELPIVNPRTNRTSKTFKQAGKRDRIAKLPDGRIALMETKTVGENIEPGSDYRNVLSINQQISMYVLAARAEGIEVETTIYDCIRKPTIKPCSVPLLDDNGDKIVLDAQGQRVFNANGKPRQTASTKDGYVLQVRDMTPQEWAEKLNEDIQTRPEYYFQRFEVPRLEDDLIEFQSELWDIARDIHHSRKNNLWYRNTSNCRMFNSLCKYYGICANEIDTTCGVPQGFREVETVHEEL